MITSAKCALLPPKPTVTNRVSAGSGESTVARPAMRWPPASGLPSRLRLLCRPTV
jgi:hypothetical protein